MDTALFSTTSRLCSKHVVIRLSIALSILLACGLLIQNSLPYPLPFSLWGKVLWSPNMESYQQVILHYSFFPRLIMALICGAGLALAGCVMQAVLRNPLASPTTLGVASGGAIRDCDCLTAPPTRLGITAFHFFLANAAMVCICWWFIRDRISVSTYC